MESKENKESKEKINKVKVVLNDEITLKRIESFHPDFREELKLQYLEVNKKLPKGVRLRFSHVLRTIEEQNNLYAQGRTKEGKVVTNAKGGQSIHNFGLAFDIVILLDVDGNGTFETPSWKQDKHFKLVVDYFRSEGYTWGGSWATPDRPHFQKNYLWQTLHKAPKFKDKLTGNIYPIL